MLRTKQKRAFAQNGGNYQKVYFLIMREDATSTLFYGGASDDFGNEQQYLGGIDEAWKACFEYQFTTVFFRLCDRRAGRSRIQPAGLD